MAKMKVKAQHTGKVRLESGTGTLILTATTTPEELVKFSDGGHVQGFLDPVAEPVTPAK